MIAAMDRCGLIGNDNGLPWHLPKDLQRFRAFTWGKPIIMGRRTFETIGKPLPGRFNIVLTQNPEFSAPGCRVARTFQEALAVAADSLAGTGGDEVMLIGGGKVYAEAIPSWDRFYLTVVAGQFEGRIFFPLGEFLRQNWRLTCQPETHSADENNRYAHTFYIIERIREGARRSFQQEDEDRSGAGCTDREKALEGFDLAAIFARGKMGG
jgi:dihydrofolate reductase